MAQGIFDATTIDIKTSGSSKQYTFRANGSILKFDGFLSVYPMKFEETELPELSEQELLQLHELISDQHFTQPPARYSEATLIKELEKNEIGRPSTYAPIIFTIQNRNYVEKNDQKKFQPTEIGIVVNDLLVKHFPQIVDAGFTASMEENLDDIAKGEKEWVPIIQSFYKPFSQTLEEKYEEVKKQEVAQETTDKKCPNCEKDIIIRLGRFGKFFACSGFPDCRYTEPLEKRDTDLGIKCPICADGGIVEKRTKKKKFFFGCNKYPDCDFALWDKPTGEKCPICTSLLVEKIQRKKGDESQKIVCSSKECDFQKEM